MTAPAANNAAVNKGAASSGADANSAGGVARIALRGRRLTRPSGKHPTAGGDPCVVPAFVAGPENQLLGRVVGAMVGGTDGSPPFDAAARPLGPVTLVGPSGCGKTHLAHGLAELWHHTFGANPQGQPNRALPASQPEPRRGVAYLTASDFARQVADAIEDGAVAQLRQQLRSGGMLVIDDLDRLSSSAHVQEELLHTIDALVEADALVVVATASLPAETPAMSRALVSRLAQGVLVEIAPLSAAARAALLTDAANCLACRIEPAAVALLADRLPGEPPRVVGAAIELRQRFGRRIDTEAAEQFLTGSGANDSPPLRSILAAAARYYGLSQKMLTSGSRRQTVVLARAVSIYLARQLTPLSYQEIGRALGGRDHTTILHNYRRIDRGLKKDVALRSAIDDLHRSLTKRATGR